MLKLSLVRIEQSSDGAIGALSVNGRAFSWTLQPDVTDEHFQIHAGEYEIRRFHGKTHKDTFEIVVPGHTALLFHSGNTEDHTEGCILLGYTLGQSNGKRAVLSSKDAFVMFMALAGQEQRGTLKITDCY